VLAAARRLAGPAGDLGLGGPPVTTEEVRDAMASAAGPFNGSRVTIDPARVLAAATRAGRRLGAVATAGGRVAFATAHPASLLPLYAALARASAAVGAALLESGHSGAYPSGRSLWWLDGVAVGTDGRQLYDEAQAEAGDEWLFAVGRPALAVADGVFAAAAIAAGLDVVAFADLDDPVPALAAHRGRPVEVVTVGGHRPPVAYLPVLDALLEGLASSGPVAHGGDASGQPPHLATEASGPYAAPQSGGEG
jgi:hypothetical protein